MQNSVDHKCPSCCSPLKYNPKGKNWKCEYCGSSFTKDQIVANTEKYEKQKVEKKQETVEMDEYVCQNCGAKIVTDKNTSATFCVYCKNTAILKNRLTDEFEPSKIIPFAKTKEDAIAGFRDVCKGKLFLPKEFKNEKNINEITGVYIPFWLNSYEVHAEIAGKATKVTSWTSGDKAYTKTDTYDVDRKADYSFNFIPVDGSVRFDDAIMNSVEPFNYIDLIDFSPSYLSGFLAEKYDVPRDKANRVSSDRAHNTALNSLSRTINYSTFYPSKKLVKDTREESEYVLLPVWLLNIKYKDKLYPFAMNGQTGKMIGNMPYSKGAAFKWFMIIFSIIFVIAMIITWIL